MQSGTSQTTPPIWRRAWHVLADEGVTGIQRRTTTRLRRRHEKDDAAAREYQARSEAFKAASPRLGQGDLSRYYWYHTIDLGNGIVTPGDYDYRELLPLYRFPSDMRGMTVLDVGSATGFFAFEFERRGAEVVSVELPSIADWDMPQGPERDETLARLMKGHGVSSIEELTRVHLHGPFEVCRTALGSKVSRCYSRIYDLTPAKLGHDAFDMIFAGDILLHTFSPLAALAALAPLCRDLLVVSQMLAAANEDKPLMLFTGGTRDHRTWWHPNRRCLEQMLERVGFTSVELVAQHTPFARGGQWVVKNESIFHARKPQH